MTLYRTTRYSRTGKIIWQRYSVSQHVYAGTSGQLSRYYPGKVTLETVEIGEAQFQLVKVTEGKPRD